MLASLECEALFKGVYEKRKGFLVPKSIEVYFPFIGKLLRRKIDTYIGFDR